MSTIKTETLSTPSNATVPVDTVVNGTAKAWVNFNGTGTVAIRRAFNVSSITDEGTGQYSVNFTTAMPDADYAFNVSTNGTEYGSLTVSPSTTSLRRYFTNSAGSAYVDQEWVSVSIFS